MFAVWVLHWLICLQIELEAKTSIYFVDKNGNDLNSDRHVDAVEAKTRLRSSPSPVLIFQRPGYYTTKPIQHSSRCNNCSAVRKVPGVYSGWERKVKDRRKCIRISKRNVREKENYRCICFQRSAVPGIWEEVSSGSTAENASQRIMQGNMQVIPVIVDSWLV